MQQAPSMHPPRSSATSSPSAFTTHPCPRPRPPFSPRRSLLDPRDPSRERHPHHRSLHLRSPRLFVPSAAAPLCPPLETPRQTLHPPSSSRLGLPLPTSRAALRAPFWSAIRGGSRGPRHTSAALQDVARALVPLDRPPTPWRKCPSPPSPPSTTRPSSPTAPRSAARSTTPMAPACRPPPPRAAPAPTRPASAPTQRSGPLLRAPRASATRPARATTPAFSPSPTGSGASAAPPTTAPAPTNRAEPRMTAAATKIPTRPARPPPAPAVAATGSPITGNGSS